MKKIFIPKCGWYFRRLSAMPLGEVIWRLYNKCKSRLEWLFLYRTRWKYEQAVTIKDYQPPIFLITGDQKEEIKKAMGDCLPDIISNANELLEHKMSLFALESCYLGEKIDWHKDYAQNRRAPIKFGQAINYRDEKVLGNVKYIWEINRHHHLVTLAKALFLSAENKYAEEIIHQLDDWIGENPYLIGINWASSLEVALRLLSWSWTYWLAKAAGFPFQASFTQKFKVVLYRHCQFVANNLSRYSSANNHLIGESAGLFIAATLFPELKEAARWQHKAYKILVKEIKNQVFEDGVDKEQAISYHRFVLELFLLCALLGRANRVEFPDYYWQRIEKMLEFINAVVDNDGSIFQIGDSDDGRVLPLDNGNGNDHISLLFLGAVLFNRADFIRPQLLGLGKSSKIMEKTLWLLGPQALEKLPPAKKLEETTSANLSSFKQGGYFVFDINTPSIKDIKLIFDCGPLGYLSLCAHGHADALSFCLNAAGRQFIIDSGTYAYHTQPDWRAYFRATAAHNTIRIDHQDQSVIGGAFLWTKKARAFVEQVTANEKELLVKGYHNGYRRLKPPAVHLRTVAYNIEAARFEITDQIISSGSHKIEQFFHFAPQVKIYEDKANHYVIENQATSLVLIIDAQLSAAIYRGEMHPILGWASQKFDTKFPISTLAASTKADAGLILKTHLSFIKTPEKGSQ